GQGAQGCVGFSGYGDQRDMEQVRLVGCRVHKHPTLQSLPLQSCADVGVQTLKERFSRMQKDRVVRGVGAIDAETVTLCRWIRFKGGPQWIKGSRLEGLEGEDAVQVPFDAQVYKWRSFFDEATHIAREQFAVSFLLDIQLQTRQLRAHIATGSIQVLLPLLYRSDVFAGEPSGNLLLKCFFPICR